MTRALPRLVKPARLHLESETAAALLSFVTAIVLALVVYVALFDVDSFGEKLIFALVVAGALTMMLVVHHFAVPTSKLPHPDKVRRERRWLAALAGVLGAALLMLGYAAVFDLNTWAEWTVFFAIVMAAVGVGIAVQTRMR